ncbi:50S ribosomal protein L7/L12 [bacterium CG_4_10_14_0_2_um_filter_33_32]|nr:MAG: 50S ribosomal protein L7/L12 [bacterium CG_4_10_14_0_2_um_filter_33_32]PJA72527.1 MAG: 50S ribosomal protein L7/L12 [bacterium CG_4_9_14_3_um_filter_33_26]
MAEEQKQEETKEEKVEEVREEKKEKKASPSGKFKELISQIESLSALELADLVKELEERFGVSAAAPVAVAAVPGAAAGAAPAAEEKANYTVVLVASGDQKINVIKTVREINSELGLKEAKDLADNPPKEIKKDIPKADAEEAKKKLEAAGATVELK